MADIKVLQQIDGEELIRFNKDSALIKKGINHLSFPLSVVLPEDRQSEQQVKLQLSWKRTGEGDVKTEAFLIPIPKEKSVGYKLSDSSIIFVDVPKQGASIYFESILLDSIKTTEARDYTIHSDTGFHRTSIILSKPFTSRTIGISIISKSKVLLEDSIFYENGRFTANLNDSFTSISDEENSKGERFINFGGELFIESNFFSERPEHANGAQYPYTTIRASNRIEIMGMPFQFDAHHSTNDNISPDFRNFFSFRFDVNEYRDRLQKDLLEKAEEKLYDQNELTNDINKNKGAIENLNRAKQLLEKYPEEGLPDDDALIEEAMHQANKSAQMDSLYGLDSLYNDSISMMEMRTSDSSANANQEDIKKIERAISILKASNEKKEKYRQYIRNNPPDNLNQSVLEKDLYQQLPAKHPAKLLSRLEKFELGNFYEYAGEYSIRDIEMKGITSSFLIKGNNKTGVLHGKINDFQSFNLDRIEANKQVSSVFLSNHTLDYFQPTFRISRFNDESIGRELTPGSGTYFVMSINAEGEVGGILFYEAEINRSNEKIALATDDNKDFSRNAAYFSRLTISPLHFLDLKFQYDQVGSDYQSDGVYFLNRNRQTYTLGYHLRLFKNKVYLKNDYTIINRNYEQKSLENQTEKFFFDIGTRFKRIPNFQLTYTPITVDIANKIDTSFSGIDANTSVLIARTFYFKKVRKTLYNTALIYSEIRNDFSDSFTTQKGFQHFISINDDQRQFSFTSSYRDFFNALRFLSASYGQSINKKLSFNLNLAKNFEDDFYSEIVRTNLNYQLMKNLRLGAGSIFLFEENGGVNTGASVNLRLLY